VGTYTIGEVAERSGFTASALRYYEGIGLVVPAGRTESGYRVYDDHALARLAFVARAKQLGCSLEEITDLLAIWDGERCGPVQRRFHDLVTEKIAGSQRQVAELVALNAQLQTAAAHLAGPATDGPCGDDCACLAGTAGESSTTRTAVALTGKPAGEEPPIACSLDAGAVPGRLAAWQAALAHVRARHELPGGGLRLELDEDADLPGLAELVVAEQGCCTFFSFAVTVDGRGTGLEIRAPEEAADLLTSLFGAL
jgi:DNA-binding transcriptional MerR regulator